MSVSHDCRSRLVGLYTRRRFSRAGRRFQLASMWSICYGTALMASLSIFLKYIYLSFDVGTHLFDQLSFRIAEHSSLRCGSQISADSFLQPIMQPSFFVAYIVGAPGRRFLDRVFKVIQPVHIQLSLSVQILSQAVLEFIGGSISSCFASQPQDCTGPDRLSCKTPADSFVPNSYIR